MKAMTITPLLLGLLVSCGGDDGGSSGSNPSTLWLGLDGSEIKVKLVEQEPRPY